MAIRFTLVRSCPARLGMAQQGFITALRGLTSYGTVLSCPVRLAKPRHFEAWIGVAERGPVRLGQVRFGSAVLCRVRRFLARSGCFGWCTEGRGFVWLRIPRYGLVSLFREVLSGVAGRGGARHRMALRGLVLSWSGEIRIGAAGFSGELYSQLRHYCGTVWQGGVEKREALSCAAQSGKVSSYPGWFCEVLHGKVPCGIVGCARALFGMVMHGTVDSGFARLRAVGQAWALLRLGYAVSC